MSIECLNQALKTEIPNQTPTKKLILILLANYCDDNGSCYPSYKHLAKVTGLKDVKHIANIISELEGYGMLRKERRLNENGGLTSNRYYLTLDPQGVSTTRVQVSTPDNTKEDTKDRYTDDFKNFWQVYPRKDNKHTAQVQFLKVVKSYDKEKLMQNVQMFAKEYKGKDPQYIPMASTFLSQKRYLDYNEKRPIIKRSLNATAG